MKCRSCSVSFSQSRVSCERSISSAVQNEASCFLYISQTSGYLMGNITHLSGLSRRMGSDASRALYSADMRLAGAPPIIGMPPTVTAWSIPCVAMGAKRLVAVGGDHKEVGLR